MCRQAEAPMNGQLATAGAASAGMAARQSATPVTSMSIKPISWSPMAFARLFQTACRTAASSTAPTMIVGMGAATEAPFVQAPSPEHGERGPLGFSPLQVWAPTGGALAPLGPASPVLVVSGGVGGSRAGDGTLGATACCLGWYRHRQAGRAPHRGPPGRGTAGTAG